VKRWVLLVGKFIASMGAMFLVLFIYYGVALGLGLAITGSFSTLGGESLLLAMLYAVAALAVGYLVSSIMKGATGSLILTFALFLFIFSIVTQVLSVANADPWYILTFAGGTIGYITQVPYPVSSSRTISNGGQTITLNTFIPDVGVSIAVMVGYIIVALVLSYFFFKRREMVA
jgi:ABC-type transport system involved in multi-copper enzyme maturation permease subunit